MIPSAYVQGIVSGLPESASGRDVIRAVYLRMDRKKRRDPARREARHDVYRYALEVHQLSQG